MSHATPTKFSMLFRKRFADRFWITSGREPSTTTTNVLVNGSRPRKMLLADKNRGGEVGEKSHKCVVRKAPCTMAQMSVFEPPGPFYLNAADGHPQTRRTLHLSSKMSSSTKMATTTLHTTPSYC